MRYPRCLTASAVFSLVLLPAAASLAAKVVQPAAVRPPAVAAPPAKPKQVASLTIDKPAAVSAPVSLALASDPAVLPSDDYYTGIVIDARQLPTVLRSPAPAIYGPGPDTSLLYPDRSDVPTPDEVQDESIVRYYHTEAEAEAGVGGAHPLILTALAVLGPAHDALQLSADDMVRLQNLEKKLHFVESWKVGFLIPAGQ